MGENIRVVVRFRPINKRETAEAKEQGLKPKPIQFLNEKNGVSKNASLPQLGDKAKPVNFAFDAILNNVPQHVAFENIALQTCEDALNGYNGTIFAYGQTGSGKTFSMLGDESDPTNNDAMGMIPRAVSYLFTEIEESTKIKEANVKVSFVEIYKEKLRDLLDPSNQKLKIKMTKSGDTIIANLTDKLVTNLLDVLQLIEIASNYRTRQATKMNATSSRSHMVMIILLKLKYQEDDSDSFQIKYGKINFADLAGSEKVRKTGATGELLKEAQKINLSLTMLGQAISSLSQGRTHIPYRDSLLTHLLKDSLGGNCKTTLLLCASPHEFNREETINSMRFGSRCKKIKNKAKINKVYTNAQLLKMVEKLKEKNKQLKKQLKSKNPSLFGILDDEEHAKNEKIDKNLLHSKTNVLVNGVSLSNLDIEDSKLEKEITQLKEDGEKKDEKIDILEQKTETLTKEIEELTSKVTDLETEKDELNELLEQMEHTQSSTFKPEVSKWTLDEEQNEELNLKYTELKTEYEALKLSLVVSKKEYEKLKDQQDKEIFKLETNNEQQTQQLLDENAQLKHEIDKLKKQLNKAYQRGPLTEMKEDGYDTDVLTESDEDDDIGGTKFKASDVGRDPDEPTIITRPRKDSANELRSFIRMASRQSSTFAQPSHQDDLMKRTQYLMKMARQSSVSKRQLLRPKLDPGAQSEPSLYSNAPMMAYNFNQTQPKRGALAMMASPKTGGLSPFKQQKKDKKHKKKKKKKDKHKKEIQNLPETEIIYDPLTGEQVEIHDPIIDSNQNTKEYEYEQDQAAQEMIDTNKSIHFDKKHIAYETIRVNSLANQVMEEEINKEKSKKKNFWGCLSCLFTDEKDNNKTDDGGNDNNNDNDNDNSEKTKLIDN